MWKNGWEFENFAWSIAKRQQQQQINEIRYKLGISTCEWTNVYFENSFVYEQRQFLLAVIAATNICRTVENYKWATCFRSYGTYTNTLTRAHTTHTSKTRTHCLFHFIYMQTILDRIETILIFSFGLRANSIVCAWRCKQSPWNSSMCTMYIVHTKNLCETKRNENLIACVRCGYPIHPIHTHSHTLTHNRKTWRTRTLAHTSHVILIESK